MENQSAEYLEIIRLALLGNDPGDAQDRFAEFVNRHAEDETVTTSVMDMIDQLDSVRRKVAFDAVVAAVLNTPRASIMHQKGLEKWDALIERIAKEDIFRALDWAALPCLYSDQFESLHAAGLKKWTELLDRAAAIDFNRALQHARSMEDSDPTRPFSTTARLAANLIESRKPTPPAPAPPLI
jgi:hypothetical protein